MALNPYTNNRIHKENIIRDLKAQQRENPTKGRESQIRNDQRLLDDYKNKERECHTEIQKLLSFRSGGAKTQRYGLPGTRAVHYYTEAISRAPEKNCLSQEAYPA